MHKTKCTNQQADNYIIKTNLPSQDVILSIGLSDITMIAVYVKNLSSFLNFVYVALCFSRTCLGMADLRTCISCVFITSQSICIIPTWSSLGIMDSGNTMGYYQHSENTSGIPGPQQFHWFYHPDNGFCIQDESNFLV